jgi:hypothetical protein
MTDDELLEKHWGRALVHEGGHALIAVLQGIQCHGIFWNKTVNKFCVLSDVPSDFTQYSKNDYLFSAAGSAAEIVVYGGDPDDDAAKSDRLPFETAGAPLLKDISDEAHSIVLQNKRKLKRLVSLLKVKCKRVDLNLGVLSEDVTNSTGNKFGTLLSKQELETAVRSK